MLNRYKVLKEVDGELKLTTTGALFFSKKLLDYSEIYSEMKMVRFNGVNKSETLDQLVSNNSFFILLKEVAFVKRNTRSSFRIEGFNRVESSEYPYEAIREAIVNAIAHRDYDFKGTAITFFIFDDRIEITSPGGLFPPMNLENIGFTHAHRNKKICDILNRTEYMEKMGTGIDRMRESMKNHGLPEPIFSTPGNNHFKVVLKGNVNEKLLSNKKGSIENLKDHGLKKRQINALSLMTNEDKVFTYSKYNQEFNVSRSTSERDLNELVDKGFIRKIKHKNKNYFKL